VIRWKLRSVMADRRMTAVRLSELLGVNRVTVARWVGSDELPSFDEANKTLNQICYHLNCTPSDLIEYERD
jgi:DNA-binding Xre family transcriptional regulator